MVIVGVEKDFKMLLFGVALELDVVKAMCGRSCDAKTVCNHCIHQLK